MMRQFLYILFSIYSFSALGQSPHGVNLKINCGVCHNPEGWDVNIKVDSFNHDKTKFPLVGQHRSVDCRKCHPTLKFSEAKSDCNSCHTDVHQQTVGLDCERCHTPKTWLVTNINEIHQRRGFPLVGAHASADCRSCHTSASLLRYDNLKTECYDCHKAQYMATSKPSHVAVGYSTDCNRCHNMVGREWSVSGKGFEHGFFPLVGGHNIECARCHVNQTVQQKLNADCKSCHTDDYARAIATHPAHTTKIAKYECSECHNAQSWNNVRFKQHDSWFGIYSGHHKGEWDNCTDCHNNDAIYKAQCSKCHDDR